MPGLVHTLASVPRTVAARPGGGLVVFLLVVFVVMGTQVESFLTETNLFNVLNQSVFVMILAVGMTVVLIAGGIDLSVGAVAGLTAGVVASLIINGVALPVAMLAGLALGAGLGTVNGLVITRLGVPDFIATLAMLGIARGLLFVWTEGVPFIGYLDETYRTLGGLNRVAGEITIPILVALAVASAGAAMLRYTRFGRHVRASGSNPDSARLSGIDVDRVKVRVYALSGTLAALAGILLAGRLTTVQPDMGSGLELSAIAAAVLGGAALAGGRGSIFGAVLGAVVLGVIQNMINLLNIEPAWETLVVGAVILIAVVVDRLTASALAKTRLRQARA